MESTTPLGTVIDRACYLCGRTNNPLIASEVAERRFGKPLMPEGIYDFARCRDCGTLYVDSDVDEAYLAAIYANETIDVGQKGRSELEAERAVMALRLPQFKHHWDAIKAVRTPRAGDRLLDMGCQMGDFALLAKAEGVEPYGIELSEDYATRCRKRFGGDDRVHHGLLSTASYPAKSFQYITAFETLEHILDPRGALERFHDWLADDGVFAMSVPSSDYFQLKYAVLKSPTRQALPHTHIFNFTPSGVTKMLAQAGFKTADVKITGWHGPIRYLMTPLTQALYAVSGGKLAIAPSVLAVARKA